ncbi:MAG: D-2-hydroxyacid dehydrogenase [Luteolibacter sp.]
MNDKPDIVVLDGHTLNPGDNPWDAVAALGNLTVHDRTPTDQILARAAHADIILTNKTPLDAATLAALPKLRFISVLATGYNVVDIAAAKARNIPVSNIPVYGTDAVAEFVFALMLDFTKRARCHSEWSHGGEWQASPDFCFWRNPNFTELAGKTLGIVGFGRIGQRVGALAAAFNMRVLAHSRSRTATAPYPFEWSNVNAIFRESDFVSLHCPLTSENMGFVNEELLGSMKPGTFFINTARGPLVDEAALAAALNGGKIAGAACDVVSAEPIRPDNPLLGAKNLTLTPHIAWAALEARRRLMHSTAENITAFLNGNPVNQVN